jgi:hypothetical protein
MAQAQFPEPKDLDVPFEDMIGDGKPIHFGQYDVANPHPGFGKDPNILNEFGHTKYPMWVGDKIANNPKEEAALRGEEAPVDEVLVLKEDGPTVAEYVSAGYKAVDYPPKGYASKSTQEEIDAAIAAAAKHASGW